MPNPQSANRPPDGIPDAAEFGQLRSFLARQQYSQAQINESVGVVPNGRTRREISMQLQQWLSAL